MVVTYRACVWFHVECVATQFLRLDIADKNLLHAKNVMLLAYILMLWGNSDAILWKSQKDLLQ